MNLIDKFLSSFRKKHSLFINRRERRGGTTLRENEIVGAIANCIANNVGKMLPQVIRKDTKGMTVKNDRLSRLLNMRPCPEASTFDFLYKMSSDLVYNSNAFAIVFYNADYTDIQQIQPVSVREHEIFEEDGTLFFRFIWDFDGKSYTVPYQFVVHIKSRYNKGRFLGTQPDTEIKNSIDLLDTTYAGIKNVISNSASLRGYLKYTNIIDEQELKTKVEEFQSAYMNAANEGGLAGLDNTMDFKEISQAPRQIPINQVGFFRDNVYRYYGVNEKILNATYSEAEWNSFYESVIEPIAIQFSLEFTFKLFTERERGFGNRVIFVVNRLQYATLQTRSEVGKDLFDRSIITINEYRELLYMPLIEDGDVRMISLNYVKANEQSLYQIGKEAEEEPAEEGEEMTPAARKQILYYLKTKKLEEEYNA